MPNDKNGLSSKTFIEPLNDTNWETWSFLMEQCLTVNDLWDIVTGVETEPTRPPRRLIIPENRNLHAPASPYMFPHHS